MKDSWLLSVTMLLNANNTPTLEIKKIIFRENYI